MRLAIVLLSAVAVMVGGFLLSSRSAAVRAADNKAVGIQKRIPWATSKVKGSPEPPSPYRSEVAFPKLKFFEPLEMTIVPGHGSPEGTVTIQHTLDLLDARAK